MELLKKHIFEFFKKHTFAVSVTAVLIFVFFVYYSYVSSFYIPNKDVNSEGAAFLSELGVFGDFFNGVSAPFLGLIGIALTLITIYAQSQNQLEQSEKQLEQAKLQQESTFVSIFNNMVSEYRNSQRDIFMKKGRNQVLGRKVFEILNFELKGFYSKELLDNPRRGDARLSNNDLAKRAVDDLHEDRRTCYEQHMKLIYNILKYIDRKCYNEDDKKLYAGIFRSFIPLEEEKFIFYEALKFEKFKNLLEKYSMMHDLDTMNDLIVREHSSLYDQRAFV
jgi:hypothetical protein